MNERQDEDDSALTEIVIQPDGRIYVFGMSRNVLEVLATLNGTDPRIRQLLDQVQKTECE